MICQRLTDTVAVGYNQYWPLNTLALWGEGGVIGHTDTKEGGRKSLFDAMQHFKGSFQTVTAVHLLLESKEVHTVLA